MRFKAAESTKIGDLTCRVAGYNLIHVSSLLVPKTRRAAPRRIDTPLRWGIANVVLFLVVIASTSWLAALINGMIGGFGDSPVQHVVEQAVLYLPYLVILGAPLVVILLVAQLVLPGHLAHSRVAVVLGTLVIVGGGFSVLVLAPSGVTVAGLVGVYAEFLPTWLVLGLLLRKRKRPESDGAVTT
jgi:hypothetical protein